MDRSGLIIRLSSHEETIKLGQKLASELPKNSLLALSGELGAGKTTLVQGIALGLGIEEKIQSPTFVLLNLYEGLAHFDLYRLKTSQEFLEMGFEEHFESNGITIIEWPERIKDILPEKTIYIHLQYDGEGRILKIL